MVAELIASKPEVFSRESAEAFADRFARDSSKFRRALSLREPGYPLAETA